MVSYHGRAPKGLALQCFNGKVESQCNLYKEAKLFEALLSKASVLCIGMDVVSP